MIGKRAKILTPDHVEDLLVFARQTRHPIRNQVLVMLSVRAGLRASEIANLTWPMVIEPTGEVGTSLVIAVGARALIVLISFLEFYHQLQWGSRILKVFDFSVL